MGNFFYCVYHIDTKNEKKYTKENRRGEMVMKLLVSDFDHTLFPDNYENNIKKIKEFVSKGNLFVIATGRNKQELQLVITGYDIPASYYICNDGAVIYDNNMNSIFREDIVEQEAYHLYHTMKEKSFVQEIKLDLGYDFVSEFQTPVNGMFVTYQDENEIKQWWEFNQNNYPNTTAYFMDRKLFLRRSGTGKTEAILFLLEKFIKVSKDMVYTIGDNVNDISMISEFKGFSVSNAIEELKKISKGEVESVSDFIDMINESNYD